MQNSGGQKKDSDELRPILLPVRAMFPLETYPRAVCSGCLRLMHPGDHVKLDIGVSIEDSSDDCESYLQAEVDEGDEENESERPALNMKTQWQITFFPKQWDAQPFFLDVILPLEGGGAALAFCSADCLQRFFNAIVEHVRAGIRSHRDSDG